MNAYIKNGKLYTTRMINRQISNRGVIEFANGHSELLFRDEIPKKIFIKGEGWRKAPKKYKIIEPLKNQPHTYEEIIDVLNNNSFNTSVLLLGFDFDSYGDVYPIQELRMLQKHLDLFNLIAEIDYQYMEYILSYNNTIFDDKYNLWKNKGTDKSTLYYGSNFFMGESGFNVIFHGILYLNDPFLNPMTWEDHYIPLQLWLDDCNAYTNTDEYAKCEHKLNNTSVKSMMHRVFGKELAERYESFL